MGLFGFLGKKEKAEPEKEKKPQPEEVEQYSGMRVEVMTAEERLLFVAKLQEIRGTTARLYQYSDGDVFRKEETINVKIRGYSDQDAKAVYLEGAVTPEENLIWRVEDLTFVKIGNDRAFFRLDTDLEASITPVGKISFAEEPARLLNISVGGACVGTEYACHIGDKFLLKVQLMPERELSLLLCQILRVTDKEESGFVYGCQFIELNEAEREKIMQSIFDIQRKKRASRDRGKR